MRFRLPGLILVLLGIVSCATSPTGRSQLLAFPEAEVDAMGIQAFEQIAQTTPHATDAATVDYVTCVAEAITAALPADVRQYDWEVIVFEEESANAFALPGGKIGVHTGLLDVAEDQDQLAAVIGHEVAHVLAQHGNERMSQQQLAQIGMQAAGAYVDPSTALGQAGLAALGLGAKYGVLMPFSRQQESEADVYGLKLSAAAGFDPAASVPLWENMAAASEGQRPPEFLSTHPDPLNRIGALRREIPKNLPAYRAVVDAGRRPRCR